jgi:hypothetical protein
MAKLRERSQAREERIERMLRHSQELAERGDGFL